MLRETVVATPIAAYYRVRNYTEASKSLSRSVQLQGGGTAWDWYFLAMTRWHLDDDKKWARRWLAKAQAWTDANARDDARLAQIRREAEGLVRSE